jgi:hypothetical protein
MDSATFRTAPRRARSAACCRVAGGRDNSSRKSSKSSTGASGRGPRTHWPTGGTAVSPIRLRKLTTTSTRLRGSLASSGCGGGSSHTSAGTRSIGARSPIATTRTSKDASAKMPAACGTIFFMAVASNTGAHCSRGTTQHTLTQVSAASTGSCCRARANHSAKCGRGCTNKWYGPGPSGPQRFRAVVLSATESSR